MKQAQRRFTTIGVMTRLTGSPSDAHPTPQPTRAAGEEETALNSTPASRGSLKKRAMDGAFFFSLFFYFLFLFALFFFLFSWSHQVTVNMSSSGQAQGTCPAGLAREATQRMEG